MKEWVLVARAEQHGSDRRRWAGLWVVAIALAMIVLDGTIVAVALPAIIADLQLDLTEAQWVNSLYSMVFAALLLTAGRLGDRFGRRRMLLLGLAGFVTGSVLAALAGDTTSLLTARAVQGVGGAMVLPATLSTVNATFRGPDRAAAFGIWGAVMSGAAALGPLLGGWLTEFASWPLIFWINVPVGIAVFAAAILLVDETRSDQATGERGVDIVGPVLSAVGLALIVFGLIEGNSVGWWTPSAAVSLGDLTWPTTAAVSPVPVALGLGLSAMVGFLTWEIRRTGTGRATVLDLRLFRIRTFTLGNTTATLVAVGEFALLFVLPLFLVTSLDLTTLQAGLVLAAMAAGAFASGATARHLAARIGASATVVLGLALEVGGAAATAVVIGAGGPAWAVAGTLLPYGLGLGLASAQLTSTTLGDIPTTRSGAGSATQSTVRQLGAALGTAAGGTALTSALNAQRASTDAPAGASLADPTTFAAASAIAVWVAVAILLVALFAAWRLHRHTGDHPQTAMAPSEGRTGRGSFDDPDNSRSTSAAQARPSAIAQTTKD